jgi:hypothetical protein
VTPSLLLDISVIPDRLSGIHSITQAMAYAMLAFLIPFTIVEMNVRSFQAKEMPSYSGLFTRVFTVIVCLFCYKRLFGFILKVSQVMSFAILSEQQWGNFLSTALKGSDSSFPTLSILFHSVTSIQQVVLFLSSLVAVTVRDVVVMLQGCFLSLLFAFGPIAIVLAINQKSSQVARGWLANSFQVAFWSFFLRLVVRVWLALGPIAANSGHGAADDYLGMLTVNVTFTLMVLGTPIVAARLLSGENLAAFGAAALGTMQTLVIAKTMSTGKFVSHEVERFKKAPFPEQRSFFHHPIGATMTRTYERLFTARVPVKGSAAGKAPGRRP